MIIWICGTKVKILKGRLKQTVNFYPEDGVGHYDPRIVIRPPNPNIGHVLQNRVFGSKDEAVQYLVKECRGTVDPPSPKYADITKRAEKTTEKQSVQTEPKSDVASSQWVERATLVVERVLDQFILQFIDFPYLHRVEHSIHCELYRLLSTERVLGNIYPMNKWVSQPIHKEWPEYKPRPEKGNRRGNIDICILSPEKLKSSTYEEFRQGRIEPDIAIEIGLDYKLKHLREDSKKLLNSNVNHGYLVHLVRQDIMDNFDAVEEFLLSSSVGTLKTGYARLSGSQAVYKLTSDREIKRMEVASLYLKDEKISIPEVPQKGFPFP